MNINNINNYRVSNYKRSPAFGSASDLLSQGLRYLNVNEAVGATLVDFGFMAMPRTLVDARRGLDAGVETGIRENSGTLNHVLIGTVGGLSALALSGKFNKQYDVYSHSIFANNETIDILGRIWHKNFANLKYDKKKLQHTFYKETMERLRGLNSEDGVSAKWVKLSEETVDKIAQTYTELSQDRSLRGKKLPSDKINYLRNLIVSDTGAEKGFKLLASNGKEVNFPIISFLDDLFSLGRAFSTHKVARAFEASINDFNSNTFIKELKGLKIRSALLALSISSAMGASVQPFNRWLTKKRTGSDGFVGVANHPDVKENKLEVSKSFIAAKIFAALGMLGVSLASISTNFKEIPNKIQFKGKIPTLNHFKFVYGFTVASRFLAARSSDELREACFKDILGFVNWLILGGFVTKGIVTMLNSKELLNSTSDSKTKGVINWLKNKSVKTVDEVLQYDLVKKAGISTVTSDNKAIPFKDMLKKARELKMTDTLKKIKILSFAQAAGYVYSGLVLGILIPKLNIKMTEWNNRKKATQEETDKALQAMTYTQVMNKTNTIIGQNIDASQKDEKIFAEFMK